MRDIVLEARRRVYGLLSEEANDQKAESPIGRLCLKGWISEEQYLAAGSYSRLYDAVLRGIQANVGLAVLGDEYFRLESGKSPEEFREEHERRVARLNKIRGSMNDRERAILDVVAIELQEPPANCLTELFYAIVILSDVTGYDEINNKATRAEAINMRVAKMLKQAKISPHAA